MGTTPTARQLRLIRFALLGGILIFGAIAAFVGPIDMAIGAPEGLALSRPGPMASLTILLVVFAAGGLMILRRKLEMETGMEGRAKLLIIGHALCEASALTGALHILLTGGVLPYMAGLAVFGFSLLLLPIER